MPHLLDTSALLAHYRNEAGADQVQALFDTDGQAVLICSVSLPELSRRLRALGVSAQEAAQVVNDYRELVDEVVAVDAAVAEAGGDLLRGAPARLPLVEALIAAAAGIRHAVLVHRDAHLRAIPAALIRQLDLEAAPPAPQPRPSTFQPSR